MSSIQRLVKTHPPKTHTAAMSEIAPKKEKKDKKRKSEVADIAPVAPEAGTASAEAIEMEVDGEKNAKKAKKDKKEKRKSVAGDAAGEEDQKVGRRPLIQFAKSELRSMED